MSFYFGIYFFYVKLNYVSVCVIVLLVKFQKFRFLVYLVLK